MQQAPEEEELEARAIVFGEIFKDFPALEAAGFRRALLPAPEPSWQVKQKSMAERKEKEARS